MMKTHYIMLAISLFSWTGYAQAASCHIEYEAKKVMPKHFWYGTVEKWEYRSGVVTGEGNTEKACEQDALLDMKKEGWEIISHRPK